ncbi:MAG: alpha/beta fold hydrolase [Cyanobacteria bacterium J06628_6]
MKSRWVVGLGLGACQTLGLALPGWSAESITFSYGPVERSIQLDDLEALADEGVLSDDLQTYAGYLNLESDDIEQIQQVLNEPADLDVVTIDRFLHTRQGEYLLNILADVVRTAGRRQDLRAIRGPVIVSAADPEEGLTVLNVLRNFPTPTIRVDLAKGLAIARELDRTILQTSAAINYISSEATILSKELPLTLSDLAAVEAATRPGPYRIERTALRQTPLPADIYAPLNAGGNRLTERPTVVISHGLGYDRTVFTYLARHLASHGFVVIAVEHSGSSAEQINALLTGRSAMVVPDNEFVQRPTQISALLDYLEAQPVWQQQIDFERVGVLGQSFGGYTALALAGAPLSFDQLEAKCPPEALSLNISLLLQCQALELAAPEASNLNDSTLDLSDQRVKAAIAINPISSVLFGPSSLSQIETPTLMLAGGADTVAPALSEQIRPFTWLTAPERYLMVMPLGTHFSTSAISETGSEAFVLPPDVIGQNPEIDQAYVAATGLAFFERYLQVGSRYRPLLSSAGTIALSDLLSQQEIPLWLLQNLSSRALNASFAQPNAELDADLTPHPLLSPDGLPGAAETDTAPASRPADAQP